MMLGSRRVRSLEGHQAADYFAWKSSAGLIPGGLPGMLSENCTDLVIDLNVTIVL